jgi:uncharacterized protein
VDLNCAVPIPGEPSLTSAPRVVLDTNAVLDWLAFRDPAMAALGAAVTGARVHWVASEAMRQELAHVLGRGLAAARGVDAQALLQAWDRQVCPAPGAAAHTLRCRDADDQKFIDLALACEARWLVSRDRHVLALRRPAARLGLQILRPDDWQAE